MKKKKRELGAEFDEMCRRHGTAEVLARIALALEAGRRRGGIQGAAGPEPSRGALEAPVRSRVRRKVYRVRGSVANN